MDQHNRLGNYGAMNAALRAQEASGAQNAFKVSVEQQLMWEAQVEAAEWKRVAERRVRVGFAYVVCFCCFIAGLLIGALLT